MSTIIVGVRNPRFVLVAALIAVAGFWGVARGQFGAVKPAAPERHEYLHQQVAYDAITKSLNDFDAQGWEIIQVVPVWQIKNENAETLLAPRSYEVFGKRPVLAK